MLRICDGSSKLSTRKATNGSELLVLLHINAPVQATTRLQVTWEHDEHYKGNFEELIADTYTTGPVVIPFNSTQAPIRTSGGVSGLAFDWNTSRIYWLQDGTSEIMRANLDGSETETLFSGNKTIAAIFLKICLEQ